MILVFSLTHQIKVNRVVDQVILPRLHVRRRREVHPELLTRILDLLPLAREAQQVGMELSQVLLDDLRRVPRWITRNKDGQQDALAVVFLHIINHARHFVQFLGADIRTVREAKVHERVLALEVCVGKGLAVVVGQSKRTSDEWSAHAFAVRSDALTSHAVFFVAEVHGQTGAGEEEEQAGLP